MTKLALICGVRGQDGAYLAQQLLAAEYRVVGTSRSATTAPASNLSSLGISGQIEHECLRGDDFRSVLQVLAHYRPTEIYNLAGQTSVSVSFQQPVETLESIATGTLNILEAIRFLRLPCRYYNAGSSECFGDTGDQPATEDSPFNPRSPYAVAKVCAANLVQSYREAYGIFACTGFLFNHESPLRPTNFVTRKIVKIAYDIKRGEASELRLGNIDIERDWGWAPDYVTAMRKLLQQPSPSDVIIATGRTVPLSYFVEGVFSCFGLDASSYIITDPTLLRPADLTTSRADPSLAAKMLGWQATHDVDDVITLMCTAEQNR